VIKLTSSALNVNGAAWTPDGTVVVLGVYPSASQAYRLAYQFDTSLQGYSNGIVFGNSAVGANYDADVNVMGGAKVNVAGKVWFDNVN
jgi:hypothetical protein